MIDRQNPTELADEHWLTFFQRFLTEPSLSRVVVTSQVLPGAMVEWHDRYPNCWRTLTLHGLSAAEQVDDETEQLALFRQSGIDTTAPSQAKILCHLGKTYEGHPYVAYDWLREDRLVWQATERLAAQLWLDAYEPEPDAPNLERLRGYLEAFDHYCEIEDWAAASALFMKDLSPSEPSKLYQLLSGWACYQEQLKLCQRLCNHATREVQVVCYNGIGGVYRNLANYPEALSAYQLSFAAAQEVGDLRGKGKSLGNMGLVYNELSQYRQAINYHNQYSIRR